MSSSWAGRPRLTSCRMQRDLRVSVQRMLPRAPCHQLLPQTCVWASRIATIALIALDVVPAVLCLRDVRLSRWDGTNHIWVAQGNSNTALIVLRQGRKKCSGHCEQLISWKPSAQQLLERCRQRALALAKPG